MNTVIVLLIIGFVLGLITNYIHNANPNSKWFWATAITSAVCSAAAFVVLALISAGLLTP
jgi:hypothetical protein